VHHNHRVAAVASSCSHLREKRYKQQPPHLQVPPLAPALRAASQICAPCAPLPRDTTLSTRLPVVRRVTPDSHILNISAFSVHFGISHQYIWITLCILLGLAVLAHRYCFALVHGSRPSFTCISTPGFLPPLMHLVSVGNGLRRSVPWRPRRVRRPTARPCHACGSGRDQTARRWVP